MLQFCIFGGYEGRLRPEKKVHVTVFGACELVRPTLARQILSARETGLSRRPTPQITFVTIFGGTEIRCPTLAEEFVDLKELYQSGVLSNFDWDRLMSEVAANDNDGFLTFTLFGGFEEAALPSEDVEAEALALHRHLGNISDEAGRVLQLGVGQQMTQRRSVLRQAISASA